MAIGFIKWKPASEESVSARELSQRWQQLVGTEVDAKTYWPDSPA